MNRLASAFSNAPSSSSETSGHHRHSPLDSTFTSRSDELHHPSTHSNSRHRSVSPHLAIYDDPRQTRFPVDGSSSSWGRVSGVNGNGTVNGDSLLPKRPGLLRHVTDEGVSRSATPKARSRERNGGEKKEDRSVRVNVLNDGDESKRGWGMSTLPGSGRVTAMVKGPNGRYAVGGGQYLRILKVSPPSSGQSTPVPGDHHPHQQQLAKGAGGTTITELANLWRGQWGVSKGVNDLDWGVGQFDTKVISACPSGNILVFDVNKGKLEREISGGHPRPMNVLRLCKTPSHSHLLLSGGTEGQAKIWDLREKDPTIRKYFKHSVPITSIAFSPDSPHNFLVGLDNGSIQRYDMRNHLKAIGRIWGAHGNKAVMDLKWREGEEAGWLASAGADRTVQIWDMSSSWERPPSPIHTLHTAYPLRRISWRPGHETELAIVPLAQTLSSSSIDPSMVPKLDAAVAAEDAHIEVWDVRRHYVAKYAIPSGDSNAIGLEWSDENTFVSAFQNGVFAQIEMSSTTRALPLEAIPRQVVAWNVRGEMGFAVDRFKIGEIPFDDLKSEFSSHWDKVGKKPKGIGDAPYEPLQSVGILPDLESDIGEEGFAYLAENYKIEGASPADLCIQNAEVARSCGRDDDARFWVFLRLLIEEFDPAKQLGDATFNETVFSQQMPSSAKLISPPNLSPRGATQKIPQSPAPIPLQRLDDTLDDVEELLGSSASSASSSSGSETSRASTSQPRSRFLAFAPPDTRRLSESHSGTSNSRNVSISTVVAAASTAPAPTASARATPRTLFAQAVAGQARDKERSGSSHSKLSKHSDTKQSDTNLDYPDPYGVVQTTTTPPTMSASLISSGKVISDYPDPYGVATKSDSTSRKSPGTSLRPSPKLLADQSNNSPKRDVSLPSSAPNGEKGVIGGQKGYGEEEWETYRKGRVDVAKRWWKCYVDDGEVQMATTVFGILRDVVDFSEEQCERIACSYVEILEGHRLPVTAGYIRRHAGIPSLEVRGGDEGMTHIVTCQRCRKSTGPVDIPMEEGKFWWCKNCKASSKVCVVCHRGVKGLWMGCGRCKHGGHEGCMRWYFYHADLRPHNTNQANTTYKNRNISRPHSPHGVSGAGSSLDSDKPRTSEETHGDSNVPDDQHGHKGNPAEEVLRKGWNVCPRGCGCKCRVVVSNQLVDG